MGGRENFCGVGGAVGGERGSHEPLLENGALLGGGTGREVEGHDWEYLLTALNLLHKDVTISRGVLSAGRWVMGLSLVWAAAVLVTEFRRRTGGSDEAGLRGP